MNASPTSAVNWLAQLAPAHAPPPPGWWPPAPGWWLLAALLLVATLFAWRAWQQPRRVRRRSALAELRRIRAETLPDAAWTAREIESLMRRYAIACFGRAAVARLSGRAWLEFVGAHGGAPLASDAGDALLCAAFGGPVSDRRDEWLAAAQSFVMQAERAR